MLMDMTFGFSRQKQDVLGPDFQAGNFGLDVLGIPGTNDQGMGDAATRAIRGSTTGFSAVGNRDGWNPIFRDERTYSLATNVTKVKGRHDIRGGYFVNFLYLDHWQPETGNPRGRFEFLGNMTGAATAAQTSNFYNQFASFLLGQVGTRQQERAERSDDRARMAARAVPPRSLDTEPPKLTLDLGLRWEYYPIMTRADGRGIDRLDLTDSRTSSSPAAAATRRPTAWSRASATSRRGVGAIYRINDKTVFARRLRHDLQRDAVGAADARRQRLPGDHRVELLQRRPVPALRHAGPGHPDDRGAGREHAARCRWIARPDSRPEVGNVDRGTSPHVERRVRTAAAVRHLCGRRLRRRPRRRRLRRARRQRAADARRRQRQPAVRIARAAPRDLLLWGQHLETEYNSLQIALNKPFTQGPAVQGRLHPQQVDERVATTTAAPA